MKVINIRCKVCGAIFPNVSSAMIHEELTGHKKYDFMEQVFFNINDYRSKRLK
jgi:hypothetical protein